MKVKGIFKVLLWFLAGLVGLLLLIIALLQPALNSSYARKIIDKLAVEFIDGKLEYSRLHISLLGDLPNVRVTLDTVVLTYPHDRFAAYDNVCAFSRMVNMGRGEEMDTLACFDHFTVAVNPFRFIDGSETIRLTEARLHSMKLYAHQYNDSTFNWNVFKTAPKDTVQKEPLKELPWISVGEVKIERRPRVVYTNLKDTLFAMLGFRNFEVRGDVKLNFEDNRFDLKNFGLRLDTMRVMARLPKDTLGFMLDSLVIGNPEDRELTLEAGAKAAAFSSAAGRVRIPVWFSSNVRYDKPDSNIFLTIHPFEALVADVPLKVEGTVEFGKKLDLDAHVSIPGGDLSPLIKAYGPRFLPVLEQFPLNSQVRIDADVAGQLGGGSLPDLDGKFNVNLSSTGTKLDLKGSVNDLLWGSASYSVEGNGYTDTETLSPLIPESLNLSPCGRLNLKLKASTNLNELKSFKFRTSKIFAKVESPKLSVEMPSDSLAGKVSGTTIAAGAGEKGLMLYVNVDTLKFSMGNQMRVGARGTKATYVISKVPVNEQMLPRVAATLDNNVLFARFGVHKIKTDTLHAEYALVKRLSGKSKRAKLLDSLQRIYPSASRDSLIGILRGSSPSMSDVDFKGGDVAVKVDSSVSDLLKHWNPSGRVSLAKAYVSTPVLPLKTRLYAFDGCFDTKALRLDTLNVSCGTSDIRAKGKLEGIRGLLMGRKSRLKMNLDVDSDRLNLNELIYAFQNQPEVNAAEINSDTAYAAVQDSISTNEIEPFSAVVMPSNLQANISLDAKTVDFIDLGIRDFTADLSLRNRTLQLENAYLASDYGHINLDAYYYTRRKDDIGCGIDISVKDVSADGIIHLFKDVGTMMPALRSFEGNLNCDVAATAKLDTNLNVVMPSLDGLIRISGTDLNISDAGDLRKITRLLRFKNKNIGHIDNMYVNAVIRDNELTVLPFEIGVDRYRLALDGVQGFDMSMKYHVSILKMPFLLIPFGINIYGTPEKWKFSLCAPKYRNGKVPTFTKQLDGVQLNMGKSIRNVLSEGVDAANSEHRKKMAVLSSTSAYATQDPSPGNSPTSDQLESFAIETAMRNQEEELDLEVEDALASAILDTKDLTVYVQQKTSRKELRKAEKAAAKKK